MIGFSCKPSQPQGTITISKTEFAPNEQIPIKFTASGKFGPNAWIGIIPSAAPHGDETKNDEVDVSYQYFTGTNGDLTFNAPLEPGNYDLRMNSTDQTGVEVTSVSFKVIAPKTDVSLKTDKTEYKVGEDIVISYTAPYAMAEKGWIGVIPSSVAHGSEDVNDANDVAYEYLKKQTNGTITLKAPEKTGSWDIRMNDTDAGGKEVASVTISVK